MNHKNSSQVSHKLLAFIVLLSLGKWC